MSERRFRKIKQFKNMIQTSNLKPTTFSIGVLQRSSPPWCLNLVRPLIPPLIGGTFKDPDDCTMMIMMMIMIGWPLI